MKTIIDLVTSLKTYFIGKDTAAKQAVEANIAPVETDATASAHAYLVGDQLILNDVLYDVTASIAVSDPLATSGAGANISAADTITEQIKNNTVTTDATPTENSTNPVQSGGVYSSEKAAKEIIAPVETDATASVGSYVQGDQLILNDVLYNVTAAITAGDALTVGTNIAAADTITKQIADTAAAKENAPTILTQTLAAGATTLTFTDASIGNNSRISPKSDPFVLGLITDMVQSGTTITVTCAAQASAVSVMLEVYN